VDVIVHRDPIVLRAQNERRPAGDRQPAAYDRFARPDAAELTSAKATERSSAGDGALASSSSPRRS
jgi:hypothetical protein